MQAYEQAKRLVSAAAYLSLATLLNFAALSRAHAEDWLTFAKTAQRQGYNGQETVLTSQTVPGMRMLARS